MPPTVLNALPKVSVEGFEVGYVGEGGTPHRLLLADVWAVRFEVTAPVRRFMSRKGQRHLPGRWWSATDGGAVAERTNLLTLNATIDVAPASTAAQSS